MSDDADDLAEFHDLAKGIDSASDADAQVQPWEKSCTPPTNAPPHVELSKLVQWIVRGNTLHPAGATVKTLPAGVYVPDSNQDGVFFRRESLSIDNIVVLPDSKSEEVVQEIHHFWTLKDKFARFGFIHKRGFLLYGPAGSGKTSTLMRVTCDLVAKEGVVFFCGGTPPGLSTSALKMFRSVEPDRPCMVVLEDIDATIEQWGEQQVLALLDGEGSIGNVMYIATTNYPEKLDGRIVNRPSRFDRVIKIGMPSFEAREAYLRSRHLELPEEELMKWVKETEGFSIAHLKEVVVGTLCLGQPLEAVVRRLRSMAKAPKSDSPAGPVGFGS